MIIFGIVLATVALAAYFGYLTGVRAERGRAQVIEQIRAEANPPERRGVRLSRIRVTR